MWTTQAYLVSLYLSCPSGMGLHCPEEADRDRLRKAVRRGDVGYHAFPFNAQPELCDAGLFAAGFELVRDRRCFWHYQTMRTEETHTWLYCRTMKKNTEYLDLTGDEV